MVSQGKFTQQSSTGAVCAPPAPARPFCLVGPQRSRPKGRQATCESAPCHLPPVFRPGKSVPGVVGQISRTVRDMNSGMGCQCFGGILSMDGDITISRPSIVHRYQQRDTLAESNLTMDNPVPKIIAWFGSGVSPSGVPLASHGEVKTLFPIPLMDSSMGKLIDMSRIAFTTLNIRQIITTVTHPILTIVV